MKTLYEGCRFEYAVLGSSVWCSVFPEETLRLMEYRQDLKYYWRYGHGKAANYQPSCLVLKDLLQTFRYLISVLILFIICDRYPNCREVALFLLIINKTEILITLNYLWYTSFSQFKQSWQKWHYWHQRI